MTDAAPFYGEWPGNGSREEETASARIKGDKDRENPVERPQPLETGDDLTNELVELAYQYLSDLRYPPFGDSKDRRIERIKTVLEAVEKVKML